MREKEDIQWVKTIKWNERNKAALVGRHTHFHFESLGFESFTCWSKENEFRTGWFDGRWSCLLCSQKQGHRASILLDVGGAVINVEGRREESYFQEKWFGKDASLFLPLPVHLLLHPPPTWPNLCPRLKFFFFFFQDQMLCGGHSDAVRACRKHNQSIGRGKKERRNHEWAK